MKNLDKKAPLYFFLKKSAAFILIPVAVHILLTGEDSALRIILESITGGSLSSDFIRNAVIVSIAILIPALVIDYLIVVWIYSNYKYALKEDGFYKEFGVINKRYVTIPYERIQNIDIKRGILARLLGLSELEIQTAGGGILAEGKLVGVSEQDALKIRDELLARAKKV